MFNNIRLNPEYIFTKNFSNDGLKHKIVNGSLAMLISQGISFGMSMVNTLVLARLLVPEDFGIIGMVTVFINFLLMFKDAGLSTATIQNEEIHEKQISTLFWINSLISICLGVIVLIASPLVSYFYKRPELTAVTAVLSFSFILQGFSVQHNALLQRHLKFSAIAITDIAAQITSIAVAVVMAALGMRYWALVGGTITKVLILLILTFYMCPWKPGKISRGTGARRMLKFGGHLTLSYFFGYMTTNLDSLLIGRFIGAGPLGIYSRAFTLLMQPLTQIRAPLTNLSLPVLSSLKNDHLRYNNFFGKLLDISISLAMPVSVYCFIESEFLIKLLLGHKWIEAVPVFRILSLGGVFVALSAAPGVVMLSHGYSGRYLNLNITTSVITTLSFIAGIFFGIKGVAASYSAASFLKMIPLLIFGFRGTPVKLKMVFMSMGGPLLSALAAGSLAYVFSLVNPDDKIIKHIFIACIFIFVYIFLTILRKETRKTALSILESVVLNLKRTNS